MPRSRYPDKWSRGKYDTRLPYSAPYGTEVGEQVTEDLPRAGQTQDEEDKPIMEKAYIAAERGIITAPPATPKTPAVESPPIAEERPPAQEPALKRELPIMEEGPMTKKPQTTEKAPHTARGRQARQSAAPAAKGKPTRLSRAAASAQPLNQQQPEEPPQENEFVCGKNAVLAALRSGQSVNRVLLAEGFNSAFAAEVIKGCREQGVSYQFVPKNRLLAIAGPDHRGVVCEFSSFNYAEVEDMLAAARERGEQPLLLLLDGVEDPHNLGAVIRTALCAGAHGVIIPKRRSAALNATVAKTSAGASAYLPVARVSNLTQTARELKDAGLWLAAADMDGRTAWKASLDGPLALVLGGEDKGVSPLLKQQCDFCVSLPMSGTLGSLNVSAAAAALLYEIRRQREV